MRKTKGRLGGVGLGVLVVVAVSIAGWLLVSQPPTPPPASGVPRAQQPEDAASLPHEPSRERRTAPSEHDEREPKLQALERPQRYSGPVRDRRRADELREALAALYAEQLSAGDQPAEAPHMPPVRGTGNQAQTELGEYVGRVMREQFVPLATSCYEPLLERRPSLAGNVALEFSILGEPAVGGVVVDVALGEATTLLDVEFETCITESMYSVIFAAPPKGHPAVTVTQSLEFAP